ncbi:unnamed protein product [marine sediment metagenome]|uniref:Uncharacterized protein n=1 Tax=marine sediment metagenome TaxID=412755 RepID=X1A808_9ZZZZ
MVDVTRKHVAPPHRVLVDAKAFLNTTIDAGVLYFTPGQIELMRNLMQYAGRRSTFVSDYFIGYYLSPTDADWNLIQAEVADLEETLMGNNNVIWGYNDRITEDLGGIKSGDGQYAKMSTAVPAGYVHRIEAISIRNNTMARGGTGIWLYDGSDYYSMAYELSPSLSVPLIAAGPFTLKEGDQVNIRMGSCLDGDNIEAGLWGYQIEVPA